MFKGIYISKSRYKILCLKRFISIQGIESNNYFDEILIKDKKSFSFVRMKDYFLEKSIYMKVFFKSKIKSLNYEVSVMDGIAYVIGIAEDQEEHELLLNLISTIKGIKQVVTHVITVDSDLKLKIEYI